MAKKLSGSAFKEIRLNKEEMLSYYFMYFLHVSFNKMCGNIQILIKRDIDEDRLNSF